MDPLTLVAFAALWYLAGLMTGRYLIPLVIDAWHTFRGPSA